MKHDHQNIDWAKGIWRKNLFGPRRFMWSPDAVDNYAAWMDLNQGMTAVDVGCGLGYLGYTYWPYFGQGGTYIGIDKSDDLLSEAAIAAPK